MNIKRNDKNNTYYFSISLGFDPITGKRRQTMRSGFRTIKEAEKEYSRIKHHHFEGKHRGANVETIDFPLLCEMYALERKDKIKITTFNSEQGHINFHVLSYFEKSILQKIMRADIVSFQQHLQDKGLSNNTINKIMLSLKMIFDCAIQNNYLQVNPCTLVKRLKVEKQRMNFWTPTQFQTFIKSVEAEEKFIYTLFFTFAYLTGGRLSEILGCTWDNINFDAIYMESIAIT